MSNEKPNSDWNVLTAVALLGQLGLAMAVPIVLCAFVGARLDEWLHGHGVVVLLMILLGILTGAYGVYRLLAKELKWKP